MTGFFLFLFVAALPHSIAAAQIAASLGALTWLTGLAVERRRPVSTLLDLPILLFMLVTTLAAVFSLEPVTSLAKLRKTALILIIPWVADTIRTRRQAFLLVAVLLTSASVPAGVTGWQKIIGEGVEITTLAVGSPLHRAGVRERHIILACNHQRLRRAAQFELLLKNHTNPEPLRCQARRRWGKGYEFSLAAQQEQGSSPVQELGYSTKTYRRSRAHGTYSHYVTYAEVLLQLAALACGLWLAYPYKGRWPGGLLVLVPVLLGGALAATLTRASWAGLALAVLVMLWIKLGWRGRVVSLVVAVLALAGMNLLLEQWRGVGFYNPEDSSLQFRQMLWADGLRLIGEHPWLGVGMDTVLVRWQELGIGAYEKLGFITHFHSNPIQLGVERGLAGLATWLLLMATYLWVLARLVRRNCGQDWATHGIALGVFGGVCGFLASGLVHYNLGDSEVAMVLWLLAGVTLALDRLSAEAG